MRSEQRRVHYGRKQLPGIAVKENVAVQIGHASIRRELRNAVNEKAEVGGTRYSVVEVERQAFQQPSCVHQLDPIG